MYVYQSHMGGLFVSDEILDYEQTYCEICGDSDFLIGYAETREEAWNLLKDDTNIDGLGGWDYDYVQEFLKNLGGVGMKKNFWFFINCIVYIIYLWLSSSNKSLGGNMTLKLEPGLKLEEITWKEDSLWYLTRPMREEEEPETHTFQQSSEFGILEGTVTVVESKEE